MNKLSCGICNSKNIRIYRPYGNFYRPKDNKCNDCLDDKERGWYVPCIVSEIDGSIFGYTTSPDILCDKFYNLPEKNNNKPSFDKKSCSWTDQYKYKLQKEKQ